jgi:DNA-binding MurR/RpiR family transcriptional regulator
MSPSSFSRLARAIGFPDYEALRDRAREELASSTRSFADKAQQLHDDADLPLLPRQVQACVANIQSLLTDISTTELEDTVDSLALANNVTIVGALGSAGFADYFSYLTSWFDGSWNVAGRNGVTLASSLTRMNDEDVLIVISKAPYAKRSVMAAEIAAEHGATVIIITDSHTFPGIKHAKHVFIQQIESPQFFSSYAATLVLIETLSGMLLARAGAQAVTKIQQVVEQNRRLDEFSNPDAIRR